jgi:heterodisulfide reductase subunit C
MRIALNPDLADRVGRPDEFNAAACMNCGVCSAVCPMGIELLPRKLFRYVLLGMEDRLLQESETVYTCLLCRLCEAGCPAGVNIAENVRCLRRYINRTAFSV